MEYPSEEKLKELAQKWLNGSLTPEEEVVFNQWYEQLLPAEIEIDSSDANAESFKSRVYQKVMASIHPKRNDVAVNKKRWMAWSIAAAVVLAIGLGIYFNMQSAPAPKASVVVNDIAPGSNKATLTLSNGQVIYLDSARTNTLPNQGNVQVLNLSNGVLAYQPTEKNATERETVYNTLNTPVGGQYQLQLPDGTKVWLNSASSIRYPVSFAGTERIVSITGEAYFEVKHNAQMPFTVKAGNTFIHDIGTHFNIDAYGDEPDMKVTLAEGSVEVEQTGTDKKQTMRPGEQISISKQGIMKLIKDADIEKAIAWKDGLFDFNGENLEEAMRQVSRWYGVEVDYPNGIPDVQFTGAIHRDVNASQVLDVLGYLNIKFKIVQNGDKKKIIVEP